MYIDLNDRSIKVQLKNYNMDKLSKSIKKRVNFFWLTSSVFMDTCKRFYFIFISTFSSILFWSATPLTEMVKSHKHNSRIFNVMEISRFFFVDDEINWLKESTWRKEKDEKKKINKQPNKSIWARHMNWWTRTTAPANVDDEICWVKLHSSSISSKCQLVHAKLPSNQQFAMVIIKFLIH